MKHIEFGLINRDLLLHSQTELIEKVCSVYLDSENKKELTYILLRGFIIEVARDDIKGRFPGLFHSDGTPLDHGYEWKNFIDIIMNTNRPYEKELVYEKIE